MKAEILNIEEIQEIIIAFANGDFSRRIPSDQTLNHRDSIVSGINMLGEELQETTISRDYFESIYDAVSDMLIVTDSKFDIVNVNQTTEKKLGLSKEQLVGCDAQKLVKRESAELEKIRNEFKEGLRKNYHFETSLSTQKNTDLIVNCSVSTIVDRFNKESGYLIIASDITEKKKQEQAVLKLIVSTQEEERRRLAYDLHDSLGQELNAIKMYLDTLDYMDKAASSYDQIYKECKMMIEQSINNIQSLSYDLMPKSLELVNLSYALKELCEKLTKLCTIEHNFDGKKLKLSKSTEIIIYRIFQEFINNSMKYAKDSTIKLSIKRLKGKIQFSLSDNGPGFDAKRIIKGNGILNIKSRLEALDASYSYKGTKNIGTILEFIVRHENN